ncbi:hypothetical protein MMC07_007510 [Pseudocyphellaria aurata]|nr:hypothetical protein [Pseudocyphellaria aurata]
MGVTRKVLKEGNGKDKPKVGDSVTIVYTGNFYDENAAGNHYRGKQFDSSEGRGPFNTTIGVGKVIRGWDEGVLEMSLGEKSVLTITGYDACDVLSSLGALHLVIGVLSEPCS